MIIIKNKASIRKMEEAGNLLAHVFDEIKHHIQPGITTLEINNAIEQEMQKRNLVSRTKGYMGYMYASCISLNDEVVHGIPSDTKVLQEKDIVSIDICVSFKGYCADMARTFLVGDTHKRYNHFIDVARSALNKGIDQARIGNYLSDISAAIQSEVEKNGFSVVRDFAGHGIGKSMHEDPEILNYGKPGQGPVLQAGMTLALEPMITMGEHEVYVAHDGWTVKTTDKSYAAHMEDTIVITENGPKILTNNIVEGS